MFEPGTCRQCFYPGSYDDGMTTCNNYLSACCADGLCDSCGGAAVLSCADSPDWHKEGKPEHGCADVERRNEEKNWKKKKAKKNCKKKSEDKVKAKKACKCKACDKKRFKKKDKDQEASVEIVVPVCVAAVIVIGAAAWLVRTRIIKKKQHRKQSMPSAAVAA